MIEWRYLQKQGRSQPFSDVYISIFHFQYRLLSFAENWNEFYHSTVFIQQFCCSDDGAIQQTYHSHKETAIVGANTVVQYQNSSVCRVERLTICKPLERDEK